MKLIVGLGNPGEHYENTRHNLGFIVVEHFLHDFRDVANTAWEDRKEFKSDIAQLSWKPKIGAEEKVILAKPKTYMNNSGMSVSLLFNYFKLNSEDVWVVNDELDLPLGSMKIRFGGAAAGHHGVESIIESLGTDKFWRFRLGIGTSKHHDEIAKHNVHNAEDYVLHNFTGHERSSLKKLVKRGSEALETALEKGMEAAQNRFNTK